MERMEEGKKKREKEPKNLLVRTLRKCYSLASRSPKRDSNRNQLPPLGCFSVYVGPEKERFVMHTTHINHPLFRTLLDEAESAHEYATKGPLVLPCDVESFLETLWEIEAEVKRSPVCGLACDRRFSSYQLLSPVPANIQGWNQLANKSLTPPISPLRKR